MGEFVDRQQREPRRALGGQQTLQAGNFHFSGVRPEKLGATEYTLVTFVMDKTGSVSGFEAELLEVKRAVVNGTPVAKISDAPGKTLCADETFLAYLRRVFGLDAGETATSD